MLATMLAFPQFIKSNDKGHLCVEGVECLALAGVWHAVICDF